MAFRFIRLRIPDLIQVERTAFPDSRGLFAEIFRNSEFEAHGIRGPFVQDNYSHSDKNVLRGLHFQKQPMAQRKLVTVLRGEIFDVAVDIRGGSPMYGEWVGVLLSEQNRRMLYLPEGFAHGFCVLSEEADVLYKTTAEYDPDLDRGVIWNDPEIAIQWPISEPILSEKDAVFPRLREADSEFVYAGAL